MYSDRYDDWRVQAFRQNYLKSIARQEARSEIDNAEKMKKAQALESQKNERASKEPPKEQNNDKHKREFRNETQSQRLTRLREEKYAKEAPKLKGSEKNNQTPSQKDRADYEKIRNAKEKEGGSYSLEQHQETKAKSDFHKGQYQGQQREMSESRQSRPEIAKHNGKTYAKAPSGVFKQAPDRSAIKPKEQSKASKDHQQGKPQIVKVGNKTFIKNPPNQQKQAPDRSAIKSPAKGKSPTQQKSPSKSKSRPTPSAPTRGGRKR